MEYINVSSLATFLIIIGQLCTGILLILYYLDYRKEDALKVYIASKLLYISVCIYLLFRNPNTDFFSIWLSNSFFFIALSMDLNAYLILRGQFNKKIRNYYIIFLLLSSVVFFTGHTEQQRIVYFSIIEVMITIYPVYKLLSERKASSIQRMVGTCYLFAMACSAYRGFYTYFFPDAVTTFTVNIPNVVFYISAYMITTLGSSGFILMSKQKGDLELKKLISMDYLTGIFNRRTFIEKSEKIIDHCKEEGSSLSFFMIDIDNFKQINDTYGHQKGDLVLKNFVSSVSSLLPESALFGRYGGEEFMILIKDEEATAVAFAEKLRIAIKSNSFSLSETKFFYTASIGLTILKPDEFTNFNTLLSQGDQALYQAKAMGKNCIFLYNKEIQNV